MFVTGRRSAGSCVDLGLAQEAPESQTATTSEERVGAVERKRETEEEKKEPDSGECLGGAARLSKREHAPLAAALQGLVGLN